MAIEITDKALGRLRQFQVGGERVLRLSVSSGGCSGMTYNAVIDTETKTNDEILFESPEMKVVADSRSALFMDGLRVDYSDDLIQAGFRLTNPHAKKACGCGASFGV